MEKEDDGDHHRSHSKVEICMCCKATRPQRKPHSLAAVGKVPLKQCCRYPAVLQMTPYLIGENSLNSHSIFVRRCIFVPPFSWENGKEDCYGRKS